jgi:hypothetical protein
VLISNHRKLLWSKAMAVNVAARIQSGQQEAAISAPVEEA